MEATLVVTIWIPLFGIVSTRLSGASKMRVVEEDAYPIFQPRVGFSLQVCRSTAFEIHCDAPRY